MYCSIETVQYHCAALYKDALACILQAKYMFTYSGYHCSVDISTFARRKSDSSLVLRVHTGPGGPLFHAGYRGIPHCPLAECVVANVAYFEQIPYGADYHGKSETQCMSCDSGVLRMHENNAGFGYGCSN